MDSSATKQRKKTGGGVRGKVYLVGAGPGDPGLLTIKAQRALREADLIIYDYLANLRHLAHAREGVRTIGVGKGFRHKKLSQDKINRLIIEAARRGWRVVRLKGGDPYLFGRGGEEALFLQQHKIPFEVVPGVTSATACAAYAGVPLTHRDRNSSVTFLTGHKAHDDRLDSIEWKKIASMGGTLVIYMGLYNFTRITEQLLKNGMSSKTPVCVVEWGTLPRQRSLSGPLESVAELVSKRNFRAPCMILVGETVRLRETLNWFERLPLFGKRIVITRSSEKQSLLREKLEELGAEVLEFPTIQIRKLQDYSQLDRAISEAYIFDWTIFTSTYGVEAFFDRLKHSKSDARGLWGVRFACVGPGTSEALRKHGIEPDLEPGHFETAAIAREFKKRFGNLRGRKILLPRTNIAPKALEIALKKLEAEVTRVTAYETRIPRRTPSSVKAAVLQGGADWVTFSSSSTVHHFVKILGLKKIRKIAKTVKFASIGPVTTEALRSFGLKPACQAKIFNIDGLVEAIRSYHNK